MCYYSAHAQLTSSDGVMYLSKMFSRVFPMFISGFYCIKQTHFIFCVFLYCNSLSQKTSLRAKNIKSRHSSLSFCFLHAMMSSVIYYSTEARKNEIICSKFSRFSKGDINRHIAICCASEDIGSDDDGLW